MACGADITMKSCTFFGHRIIDSSVENIVRTTIRKLIEEENVKKFYVGNNGMFDSVVIKKQNGNRTLQIKYMLPKRSLREPFVIQTVCIPAGYGR